MSSVKVCLDLNHYRTMFANGDVVVTRNGVQTTKEKYRGSSFVNKLVVQSPANGTVQERRTRFKGTQNNFRLTKKPRKVLPVNDYSENGSPCGMNPGSQATLDLLQAVPCVFPEELTRSLTDWALYGFPPGFTPTDRHALHTYLEQLPLRTYVFEPFGVMTHNPMRNKDIYHDLISNHDLLLGAVFIGQACQAIKYKAMDVETVAHLSADLYGWINRCICGVFTDPYLRTVIIQAIAALAILCHLRGQYDQWHIHLKGLIHLVDQAGGQDVISRSAKYLIYKADQNAATELAIEPYFRVGRTQLSILRLVKHDTRKRARVVIERSLAPCCTDDRMLEVFTDLIIFVDAICPYRIGLKNVDPDEVMEEWFYVAGNVLTSPEPICSRQSTEGKTLPEIISDYESSPITLKNAKSYRAIIESSIRLCLLLFGKVGIPSLPCNPAGHPALLTLLEQHFLAIIDGSSDKKSGEFVHPLLLMHFDEASFMTNRAIVMAVRPALIWCALLRQMAVEKTSELPGREKLGSSVSRDLMICLVGSTDSDVDAVPGREFDFCRLINLKVLVTENCEPRELLKRLIRGQPITGNPSQS